MDCARLREGKELKAYSFTVSEPHYCAVARQAVFGQLESDDPTIIRVIDVVIDEGKATYVRGLAARTLSAVCLRVKDAKAKLLRSEKWGPLMDALLDVIGLCNQPKTRAQLTEVDRDRVRRNC